MPERLEAVSDPDIRKVRLRLFTCARTPDATVPLARSGRRAMRNRYRDLRGLGMAPNMARSLIVVLLDTASWSTRQSVWDDVANERRGGL
jgi:hypothetical protein